MDHSVKPGLLPPRTGLEREEPEIGEEDDIPRDDEPASGEASPGTREDGDRPSREVERE